MHFVKSVLSQTISLLAVFSVVPAASGDELVSLKVGHAQSLTLSGTPTTVAVGDSDVASASVAMENTLMLMGKRPGTTNVVALGADGSEISNTVVRVVRADGRRTVSVIRAGEPQTYVCGEKPGCLAVDPGSQVIDYAQTSDPARGAASEADTGERRPSRVSTLQNFN